MSAPFEPGDLVDIVIKGARVFDRPDPEDEPGEGYDTFELNDRDRRELVSLNLSYPQITVTHVAPAEWPPQSGDVWADKDGDRWFGGEAKGKLIGSMGDTFGADEVRELYGPLTLKYREGWAPTRTMVATVTVDEPEPAEVDKRAAWIAGMREALDWLEAHPEVRLPYLGFGGSTELQEQQVGSLSIYTLGPDGERQVESARLPMGATAVEETREDGRTVVYRRFGAVAVTVSKAVSR